MEYVPDQSDQTGTYSRLVSSVGFGLLTELWYGESI